MTVGIIDQARTGSTRLPGKVLAPVLGRPLLAHQLERLQRSTLVDRIIVGTTADPSDDPVLDVAAASGADWYRWPTGQPSILAGYIAAARAYGIDTIVRVTADCPLIDPAYLDMLIAEFGKGDRDYANLVGLPDGMGAEIVSLAALEASYPLASDEEREHVTLYIRRHPERFRVVNVDAGLALDETRWTVDTQADLELVQRIIEALYPRHYTLADIRALLARHPDWTAINANVPMGVIDQEMLARHVRNFAPWLGDL